MKKKFIVLLLATLSMTGAIQAQRIVIKGKYKGYPLTVEAQASTPGNDIITKLTYAPLDNLKNEVDQLKADKKKLENEKKKLEAKIASPAFSGSANASTSNEELAQCQRQLSEKQHSLDSINAQIRQRETRIAEMRDTIDGLRSEMNKQLANSESEITQLKYRIESLELLTQGRDYNRDAVSLSVYLGHCGLSNAVTATDAWNNRSGMLQQYTVNYTHYFTQLSPLALRAGIGFSLMNASASMSDMAITTSNLTDADGDRFDRTMAYRGLSEQLSLTYLDIPVALHIGHSYTTQGAQAWVDLGMVASIALGSSFTGEGTVTTTAYYPSLNVTLHDVPELGLNTDSPAYDEDLEPNASAFVLWGALSAGVQIPLTAKLGLTAGVRLAYPLTPLGSGDASDDDTYVPGICNLIEAQTTRAFTIGGSIGLSLNL